MFDLHRREFPWEEKLRNEVRYLMRMKHQNLVQFVGYCAESSWEAAYVQGSGYYIFAEIPARLLCFKHVRNRSLDKHISDEFSDLKWNMRYEVIRGICAGLSYIQDECLIVHLDLKPETIDGYCRRLQILVCQGSLVASNPESLLKIRTQGYMAPEY